MENYSTDTAVSVTEYVEDRGEKIRDIFFEVAPSPYSCIMGYLDHRGATAHLDCIQHRAKSGEELMSYAQENIAKFDERYDILLEGGAISSDIAKVLELVNYQSWLLSDVITAKLGLYGMYSKASNMNGFPEDIVVPEKDTTLQQIEEAATQIYELAQRATADIMKNSESNSEQANVFAPAINILANYEIANIISILLESNMYSDTLWAKHKYLFAAYVADKCGDYHIYQKMFAEHGIQDINNDAIIKNSCQKDEVLEIRKSYRSSDIDKDAAFAEYTEITFMYDARNLIEIFMEEMNLMSPTKCASLLAEAYAYKSPSVSDAVAFCRKLLTADNGFLIRHELMERPEECREDIESVASEVIYERACLEYADCSSDLREYFKHHLDLEETDDCSAFTDLEAKFYSDDM